MAPPNYVIVRCKKCQRLYRFYEDSDQSKDYCRNCARQNRTRLQIRHHPLLLCYHCLGQLNVPGQYRRTLLDNYPGICPLCGRPISVELLNLFTTVRHCIESYYCEVGIRLRDQSDEWRERLPKPQRWFGWQPYLNFILTAVLSGIIGNLAYDALKSLTKRLFTERYPRLHHDYLIRYCDGIIQLVLMELEDRHQGDVRELIRWWIQEYETEPPPDDLDELIRQLVTEMETRFDEAVSERARDDDYSHSNEPQEKDA